MSTPNKMRGPGRPPKSKPPNSCTWCGETKQSLKYVLPTQHGKKEFCSETCLSESRKAYARGACTQCNNVIKGTPVKLDHKDGPLKDFCSSFCLNAYQKKESQADTKKNNTSLPLSTSPAASGPTNNNVPSAIQSYTNSNNHTISRPASTSTGSFHVETYQTFDWDLYLRETKSIAAPLECFKQFGLSKLT